MNKVYVVSGMDFRAIESFTFTVVYTTVEKAKEAAKIDIDKRRGKVEPIQWTESGESTFCYQSVTDPGDVPHDEDTIYTITKCEIK